jgi:hypothetical protein
MYYIYIFYNLKSILYFFLFVFYYICSYFVIFGFIYKNIYLLIIKMQEIQYKEWSF